MNSASNELVVVGIDLAGSSQRPTGVCVLQGLKAVTTLVFGDAEILEVTCSVKPDLVLIDAPLSLPPGRATIHDRTGEHFRPCDRVLQKRGIRFFPVTLGPMRILTERGLQIKEQLDALGMVSVECYPGGALDVWGLPRQHHDLGGLLRGLTRMGVEGLRADASAHELDATAAALTGYEFFIGAAGMIGGDHGMLLPLTD